MIKMIIRLILIGIVALGAFVAISIYSGGEKFRWFGKKVEQQSERVGEQADRVKKGSDKVMKGIEQTTEKVKDLTGRKDEKSH